MAVRLHNIIFNSMLAILLSASFVSCKDEVEENINGSQSKGGVIGFNAFQDGFQKPTTRAVIDKIDQLNKIYVLSMKQKASGNWEQVFKNEAGTGIDVLTLSNSGNLIWDYSPVENWEDGYSYKFRAFYPQTFNTGAGESCTKGFEYAKPLNGSTTLTLNNYKSAQDPRNNTDLLVSKEVTRAYTTAEGNDEPVPLKMEHLLSCVNFNISNKEGSITIEHFKLRNHVAEASYDGNNWISHYVFLSSDATKVFNFILADGTTLKDNNVNWGHLHGKEFYVEYKDDTKNQLNLASYSAELLDISKNPISSSSDIGKDYCVGLLLIPQKLEGKDETIKINLSGNEVEGKISHKVEAVIQYKYDSDPTLQTAIVDLTANGKVPEWEPGVKYTYNVSIYEYQATANITIEDWTHHTYEEELK